ncbi:MAG: NAD(P)-dependent oxidoreductase [Alphaproteobacteria bacterium]|nr:NAD(P)-dependent oxidoreductase [Alphaproteobacteria bacterium]
MGRVPADRAEAVFEDFKAAYSLQQAIAESERCLYCYDAPCIQACPTTIDIPTFIRKIATGNVKGSAKTIFDSNILGMSCARVCPVEVLCVGDCVYNREDSPPIQIGKLQRFATDAAFEAGWRFYEAGADTGKKVACIGGGPASLAAAHRLRMYGHSVTIFEKRDVLGGLNTTGVAPYKMRADRSEDEVDWVLGIGGIEVRLGVSVPGDVSWAELESEFDAIFLGFGLGPDKFVGGEEGLSNVHGAVDFIEQFKLGAVDLSDVKRALVLGGGNTAIDAVRELRGLGVSDVRMVYRGSEAAMAGYQHEWKAAKVEGVRGVWHTSPVSYEVDEGRATGVRCVLTDESKKKVPGSEHVIDADLVLVAIGQAKIGELVAGLDGVQVEWGCVVTDASGATGRKGVYCGGDCRNGGKEVVNAAAEGRDSAEAIHAYLMGGQ